VLFVAFSARRGIGIQVETDGSLFARGMLNEVNVSLHNRDNHQQKLVAELVAVRPGWLTTTEFLGEDAAAAATLNAGNHRMLTLILDTADLSASQDYKVGVLIYENRNSTDFPVKGSLLALSHVADIEIVNPLEIINANMSLCNEIAILGLESDETTA
jgi:uncharacterized membrane protein